MATTESFSDVWNKYLSALNTLYAQPASGTAGGKTTDLAQDCDTLLDRSQALHEVLAGNLRAGDLPQRELAGLKLVAVAMYDLAAASDLLQVKDGGATSLVKRKASGPVLSSDQLRNIMDAPLDKGMSALRLVESASLPHEPAQARIRLQDTAEQFITFIPQQVSELAKMIAKEMGDTDATADTGRSTAEQLQETLPDNLARPTRIAAELMLEAIGKLRDAIGEEPDQTDSSSMLASMMLESNGSADNQESSSGAGLFGRLPKVLSPVARGVAVMITSAVDLLRSATGRRQAEADPVLEQALGWLDEVQKAGSNPRQYFDRLYGMPQIRQDMQAILQSLPQDSPSARFNEATRSLMDLHERYNLTKGVIVQVVRLLDFIKPELLPDRRWGRGTLDALYLSLLGYAIYSGGDYLGWHQPDEQAWIKRVTGLSSVLNQTKAA